MTNWTRTSGDIFNTFVIIFQRYWKTHCTGLTMEEVIWTSKPGKIVKCEFLRPKSDLKNHSTLLSICDNFGIFKVRENADFANQIHSDFVIHLKFTYLQSPQKSQWYWPLSSSSKILQGSQKYCKRKKLTSFLCYLQNNKKDHYH